MGRDPVVTEKALSVEVDGEWRSQAYRTTYFREAIAEDGTWVAPLQASLEASCNGLPGHRQSTRYSAHGIHEYKGKFNPQIVRASGNLLGLRPGSWVLDPFCGSGTTLLEALHSGWNAVGIDLNPLAVMIAKAKVAALRLAPGDLYEQTSILGGRLGRRIDDIAFNRALTDGEIQHVGGPGWKALLPSYHYLESWFPQSVLVQIAAVLAEIKAIPGDEVKLVLRVMLSDIVREVSLQDPGDLRIRRRKPLLENAPVIPIFLRSIRHKTEAIAAAQRHLTNTSTTQNALLADSRSWRPSADGGRECPPASVFDAAITSPPYATALPYIDTQRLSLVLLGLLSAKDIRHSERSLIGNREISAPERLLLEKELERNPHGLPDECLALCRRMAASVDGATDGFRKHNTPALLYNYLRDMKSVFASVHSLLKADGRFAVVVGRNNTRLGGNLFAIDTPQLLSSLAEDNGFEVRERLELDTYQRYDVHQGNSIRSETLLILGKR